MLSFFTVEARVCVTLTNWTRHVGSHQLLVFSVAPSLEILNHRSLSAGVVNLISLTLARNPCPTKAKSLPAYVSSLFGGQSTMAKYISRLLPWGKGEPQARDDNLLPTSADSMRSTLPTLQGYGGHATLTTALFGIDSAQHLKLLKMAKVIVALLEDPRISMLEMAKAVGLNYRYEEAERD